MKKWIYLIVLLLSLVQPVAAAQIPEELEKALPAEAEELLDTLDREAEVSDTLSQGLSVLWEQGTQLFLRAFRSRVGGMVTLLSIVLLCALVNDCIQGSGDNNRAAAIVPMAGAAAIAVTTVSNVQTMIGLGMQTIEDLSVFSKALLPTLSAAVAASGGVVSAGLRHVAGVFFSDLLITLIRRLLLPLLYFHIAVSAADAMVSGERLKGLAAGIGKVISWMLTGSVLLYTGYLTLSGAMAESADTVAMHVTQSVMGVVPVVGNIISNAAGTVLSGAAMLKNTIGVVGMLAVLAICLVPILELAAQYLMYKLTAFLAGTFGAPQLVKLIEALGGAFGMILGMTAACALMLLISIITSVSVVTI